MNYQLSKILNALTAKLGLSDNMDIEKKYKNWFSNSAALVLAATISTPAMAVVAISDGFGDADLNNNGIPLEDVDVSVQGGVGSTTYIPGRVFVDGLSSEPTNMELDSVLDASDTGLRWLQMRGWSDAVSSTVPGAGNSKPTISIVDDSQGAMLETQSGTGGLNVTAIDDGNAMVWESRGGGSSAAGFFDQNIALGSQVGDEVKVSFDFRMWRDAPNTNSGANSNNEPSYGFLRFGLFQDTDDQLGQTNPFAGRQVDSEGLPLADQNTQFQPAVWGQDEGFFEGSMTGAHGAGDEIGATGDNGWSADVIFGNAPGTSGANGGLTRIREEVNTGRILQGSDVQTIVQPEDMGGGGLFDPKVFDFVNLDIAEVYTIELSLTRATEITEGDTIYAELTYTDKTTLETWSIGGQDNLTHPTYPGIQSDNWDYFGLRNDSNGAGEFDFVFDNFTVEVNGSNESDYLPTGLDGDFNDDGTVDAADYTVYRDNLGLSDAALNGNGTGSGTVSVADYNMWVASYGTSSSSSAASSVPEPTSLLLLGVAGALFTLKRRSC